MPGVFATRLNVSTAFAAAAVAQAASAPAAAAAVSPAVFAQPAAAFQVATAAAAKPKFHTKVATAFLPGRIAIFDAVMVLWMPQPRAQIQVPIAPAEDIRADTVFEAAANPAAKLTLPVFNLGENVVDGQRLLRVVLEQANLSWTLTVWFTQAPRGQGASPLEVTPAAVLRFVPPTTGIAVELPMAIEKEDDTTWKATLATTDGNEGDRLHQALTMLEFRTQLLARCTVNYAFPVPKARPQDEQLYKVTSRTVDVSLNRDPFLFDRDDGRIFRGLGAVKEHTAGFIPRQVAFDGRTHLYYQDELTPYLFYHLPDEFKVTRRPEAPFAPNMLVKFTSEDGSLEKMRASVEYVAAPVVNPARLEAARQALQPFMPATLPAGVTGAAFQPLVVNDINQLQLRLTLPRAGTSGAQGVTRPGVVANLTDSFKDVLTDLTLDNFQELFSALFGKSAVVFTGEVLVGGGGAQPLGSVPFNARLSDLYGRTLEELEERATGGGAFHVRLRNSSESPLTVRSIPVEILADGTAFAAHLENLAKGGQPASLPLDLAAGEEVDLDVVPDVAFVSQGAPDAVFRLDDVDVHPDTDAVWAGILDTSIPAEYGRNVTIVSFAEQFDPSTDVMAVIVAFRNGSVILRPNSLEATTRVSVPLEDVVVRRQQAGTYSYTLVIKHKNGAETRLEKTDSLDTFFLNTNA